jgi:nucleoside-diphosphate-sugar epimerase
MASKKDRTKTRAFNIDGEICSVAVAVEYVKKLIPDADLTLLPRHIEFTGKFDTAKIREEIGYRPEWPLEQGIKQVIHAVRKMKRQLWRS